MFMIVKYGGSYSFQIYDIIWKKSVTRIGESALSLVGYDKSSLGSSYLMFLMV